MKRKRKPEPITPDLISEVRAALDARRQADSVLFGLLCRVYKNPFHWRLPRDYFKAALAWLNRHDPDVKFYARCRAAMVRQIAHDLDDAFINGDPPGHAPASPTEVQAASKPCRNWPYANKVHVRTGRFPKREA